MPWVQVKPGRKHGAGDRYQAGDIFEATAAEARDFADKFREVAPPVDEELVMDATAETADAEVQAPKPRGRRSKATATA